MKKYLNYLFKLLAVDYNLKNYQDPQFLKSKSLILKNQWGRGFLKKIKFKYFKKGLLT